MKRVLALRGGNGVSVWGGTNVKQRTELCTFFNVVRVAALPCVGAVGVMYEWYLLWCFKSVHMKLPMIFAFLLLFLGQSGKR